MPYFSSWAKISAFKYKFWLPIVLNDGGVPALSYRNNCPRIAISFSVFKNTLRLLCSVYVKHIYQNEY